MEHNKFIKGANNYNNKEWWYSYNYKCGYNSLKIINSSGFFKIILGSYYLIKKAE